MNWSLFYISAALWIFFFAHFVWLKRFESMREYGMQVPSAVSSASKGLAMVTMFNLLTFLIVYGLKVTWLWSAVIVIGGYVAAAAFFLLTRSGQGTLLHKIGWIAMPVLSVGIWYVAFAG